MVRLITRILFSALVFLLLLLPWSFLSRRCYRQALDAPVLHFARTTTTLVLGDSHTESSINPEGLPHSENIAHSGDSFFFTYVKLNFFLARNPQVRTVVLGISWHNLARRYQDITLMNEPGKIGAFYPILDAEGRSVLASWDASYRVPWAKYTLGLPFRIYDDNVLQRSLTGRPLTRDNFDFFGKYKETDVTHLEDRFIARKAATYFLEPDGQPSGPSTQMADWLMRILATCEARNIRVVLVNTPVHPLFRNRVPQTLVDTFGTTLHKAIGAFPRVTYVDLSALPLADDCYYDGDHVNNRGAVIVTQILAANPVLR